MKTCKIIKATFIANLFDTESTSSSLFFAYNHSVFRIRYVRKRPNPKISGTGAACRNEETHPIEELNIKNAVSGTIAPILFSTIYFRNLIKK